MDFYGVNVQIIARAEASIYDNCAFILTYAKEMEPVDAIFNLAVVLKDAIYTDQTVKIFEESFKPKAITTKTLDELSRKICIDLRHFVVFSSVSCGRGNVGQTNYGMANSIMERIYEERAQDGLPGMAIYWGAVGDVGLVADMLKDNKELVISGTLQQRIQSCLQSLDAFLVKSRPIVGSMVVAEKRAGVKDVDILETVANIISLKDIKSIGHCTPLSDMGVDSMIAIKIKQTLEREFHVYLTAQDIRNLTFEKLCDMSDKDKRFKEKAEHSHDTKGIKLLIQILDNLDINPDICPELSTKQETDKERIFFILAIECCGSIFNSLTSKIEAPVTCLQYGVNNVPTCESVMKTVATLLPMLLELSKYDTWEKS